MPLTIFNWLLAIAPVAIILVLMLGLHWGGSKAGAIGWFLAILIAVLHFGSNARLIAYTQVKAVLLTLDVLYIIWTALLLYHTAEEAGAIRIIGQQLPALTADKLMQGLLLGWLFASFLQGMGGFGVPVAVTAPLLVGLGFNPIQAVIMACIGHGWAVNFGSLATSFNTLMAVTGLPGEVLAPEAAILLGIACLGSGAIVAYVAAGWKGMLRALPGVVILTAIMGTVQYLLATNGMWTIGATGAALTGLAAGVFVARWPLYRNARRDEHVAGIGSAEPEAALADPPDDGKKRSLAVSMSAYAVLVVLAFALSLIKPLAVLMDTVQLNLAFPELATPYWVTPAGPGRSVSIFGHTGATLLYASLIAYVVYSKAGYYEPGALGRILNRVVRGAVNSSLGIAAMVGMAVIMSHTGMTHILARGLSESVGRAAYPVVAPFIGALGAFITGSNNNSNVLFAQLQQQTADLLGLSVPLILAAQTAGGSLGSVLAPAKVIVGCSTVGLGDQEGVVMGRMMLYGLIPVMVVAVLTLVLAFR